VCTHALHSRPNAPRCCAAGEHARAPLRRSVSAPALHRAGNTGNVTEAHMEEVLPALVDDDDDDDNTGVITVEGLKRLLAASGYRSDYTGALLTTESAVHWTASLDRHHGEDARRATVATVRNGSG
jgi:hypothetical protein